MEYAKTYDLNVLFKRTEDGNEIIRKELDFNDNKQLHFFLQQLKQMLVMVQVAGSDQNQNLVDRYDVLEKGYYFE